MSNIFARSPYIIEVNEAGQTSSKIKIFLWNGTGSAPSLPQKTLSKAIPATGNLQTVYDISPYIREYLLFNVQSLNYNSINQSANNFAWCNVIVKRYKDTGTLLDTTQYKAFDGYGYYLEGANYDRGDYLLDEGTYYYHYDSDSTYDVIRAGQITLNQTINYKMKYTNLVTLVEVVYVASSTKTADWFRVTAANWAVGNKLEITTDADAVLKTYYFKPIEECKYTPIPVDFINKYGAWQREFFFKAQNVNIEIKNSEYNILQTDVTNYSIIKGQRHSLNANGQESIKLNTGWVNEDFKDVIQQLLLSERILLGNAPVILTTKTIEKFNNINTKNINYVVDFKYAYDIINSVI